MRLTVLMNTTKSLPTPAKDETEGRVDRDQVAKELERLKWLLWHGNTFRKRWYPGFTHHSDPVELAA